MKPLSKILYAFLGLLFLIGSCAVISISTFKITENMYVQNIKDNIPDWFPVLVIIPGKDNQLDCGIVYYRRWKDLLKKSSESDKKLFTYLVPKGKEKILHDKIFKKNQSNQKYLTYDDDSPDLWFAVFNAFKANPQFADFKVDYLSDGRQLLKVECTWDSDRVNVGWYEATDKHIFPKKYLYYFGPDVALRTIIFSFILTSITWIFAEVYINKRRKKYYKQLKQDGQ